MSDICSSYIIDYDEIAEFLRKNNVYKVLVQAPDGLKPLYNCLSEEIKELKELEVYFSASPSYGGCDIAYDEARRLGVEAIIHIGHNRYPFLREEPGLSVVYVPAFYKWSMPAKFIDEITATLRSRGFLNIGLTASIQHVNVLEDIAEKLEERGFKTYIGNPVHRGMFKGQILGCEYSSPLSISRYAEAYIVVAGGRFHAIGLALITDKPVYGLDPYRNTLWDASLEARKYLAKRYFILTKLSSQGFKRIGLIVGVKPGQHREDLVKHLIELSSNESVETVLISADQLDFNRLTSIDNALNLDLYVVTSCPRLPIDDLHDFYKPVLTPGEYIMLIKKSLSRYIYPW